MKITLKDVAEAAGVSRSAVSRAFTEGAPVSPEMKQRVLEAAEALGYTPNALASSLTTGRTRLVGLLVDDFAAPGMAALLDEVSTAVQNKGLHPLLINLAGIDSIGEARRFLDAYAVDGAIVVSRRRSVEFAEALQTATRPVVHCLAEPTADPKVHTAMVDYIRCGRMSARNLIDAGHRVLGFIGQGKDDPMTERTLEGFSQVCNRRGAELKVWHADGPTAQDGYEEMMVSLKSDRCEGYFVVGTELAAGAEMACADQGLDLESELTLIGLSTSTADEIDGDRVVMPSPQIARFTTNMLERAIEEPGLAPQQKAFGGRMIRRAG